MGEATWETIDLSPHGSAGPLTLVIDTTKLKDGSDVTGWVWAQFSHEQEKGRRRHGSAGVCQLGGLKTGDGAIGRIALSILKQ